MKQGWRFTGLLALGGLAMLVASACATSAPPAPTPTAAPKPPAAAVATPTPVPPKPPAPTTPTPRPATVKYGSTGTLGYAGVFIAVEKGYFKEQGITPELENFRTIAEMIPPLGTGQIDVIGLPINVPLLAAADRGVELKIVADQGQGRPGWDNCYIVLRKDLADSGKVKTAADLKGMRIAIPSPGGQGEQAVQIMMEQIGLKLADVELTVLPFGEQAAALANKAIAAAFSCEPAIVTGVQQGFALKWIPNSKLFGGRVSTSVVVYGSRLMKDQDVGRRWMIAYLKGNRDFIKAFSSKEGRQGVVGILGKYTGITDPQLYTDMEVTYQEPNGLPDRGSIEAQYKWFVEKRLYTGKKTFDELTDLSYVEYAVQQLGKQ